MKTEGSDIARQETPERKPNLLGGLAVVLAFAAAGYAIGVLGWGKTPRREYVATCEVRDPAGDSLVQWVEIGKEGDERKPPRLRHYLVVAEGHPATAFDPNLGMRLRWPGGSETVLPPGRPVILVTRDGRVSGSRTPLIVHCDTLKRYLKDDPAPTLKKYLAGMHADARRFGLPLDYAIRDFCDRP